MQSSPIPRRGLDAVAALRSTLSWSSVARRSALAGLSFAAAWANAQTCLFTGGGGSISFPALDPSVAATVSASTDLRILCIPFAVTPTLQFSGANGSAPLRMKHSSQNDYIPYSVGASYTGNVGFSQNWRITATILGANYVNAYSYGSYSDSLTATVLP